MSDAPFTLDLSPRGRIAVDCIVDGPLGTNVYVVTSGGEALVIDPAWDGAAIARRIADAHPDVRVTGIVCTHGHADHVGGVAALRRALGDQVPFMLSAGDVDIVAGSIVHQRQSWGVDAEDPGTPDRLLREGDAIAVGDAVLQVVETPGHTPGGIVLFAATEAGNIAFVGDTLFPGSCGRTDLAGGDEATLLRSLARMGRLLPADTFCFVGHGDGTTIERELASNPFMQA